MRYYKMTESDGTISIWAVRPDGMERCVYDGTDDYTEDYKDWADPHLMHDSPMPEMCLVPRYRVERIKKSEINELVFLDY